MTVASNFAGNAGFPDHVAAERRSGAFLAGQWLVVAALMFNPLLCFLDTQHILHASGALVAAVELFIIGIATWYVRDRISSRVIVLSLIVTLYVVGAHLINPTVSLKILHDLWIPYVFYLSGTTSTVATARRTLFICLGLVLFFGFFEWLAFDLYGRLFNVWQYYVDKGAMGAEVVNYQSTTAFVSGSRSANARTYFPGLFGSARIASVFLEPVSMGNFATIVFAWALSVWSDRKRESLLMMALAFWCIMMTDSRFATACCLLLIVIRLTGLRRSSLFAFILPVLIATALTVMGSMHEIPGVRPGILSDDFKGRLLFSGRLLDDWSLGSWFALAPSPVYTADTGYAYLFNNLGIPLTLVLFGVIAFHRAASDEATIFRTMMSVYFATSLCIGANSVTIKTGALLWFLYGALDARKAGNAGGKPTDGSGGRI